MLLQNSSCQLPIPHLTYSTLRCVFFQVTTANPLRTNSFSMKAGLEPETSTSVSNVEELQGKALESLGCNFVRTTVTEMDVKPSVQELGSVLPGTDPPVKEENTCDAESPDTGVKFSGCGGRSSGLSLNTDVYVLLERIDVATAIKLLKCRSVHKRDGHQIKSRHQQPGSDQVRLEKCRKRPRGRPRKTRRGVSCEKSRGQKRGRIVKAISQGSDAKSLHCDDNCWLRWWYPRVLYKCLLCFSSFTSAQDLENHVAERNEDIARKVFFCWRCYVGFRRKDDLVAHKTKHALQNQTRLVSKSNTSEETEELQQNTLAQTFSSVGKWNSSAVEGDSDTSHYDPEEFNDIVIGGGDSDATEQKADIQNMPNIPDDAPHVGDEKEIDESPCVPKVHAEMKTETRKGQSGRTVPCDVCQKEFSDWRHMVRHRGTHEEGTLSCSECDKRFFLQKGLNQHLRQVHQIKVALVPRDEKRFQCDKCSKLFKKKQQLKSHVAYRHTDTKAFKCEICEKRFTDKQALQNHHKARHSDNRPFICEICSKGFVFPWRLKSHKQCHTGERPFTCLECNKTFRSQGQLNQHKRIHEEVI